MTCGRKRWFFLTWLCLIPFSGNAITPMIAAGDTSSVFLNSDGAVWGTGDVTDYWPGATSPVPLLQLPNIVAVAPAGGVELALLADGTLWGVGWNGQGQLGNGTTQPRSLPQRVPGLSGIKAIAASSYSHVLALKEDGTVWAWGLNDHGQLGDGTKTDRYVPAQVIGLTNITKIAAGAEGSLALKADGTVWVWGYTCCGAAGDGLEDPGESDPSIKRLVPAQVHNLDQVVAITAGSNHHMALRADGTVWTWGIGDLGENGLGQLNASFDHQLLPAQIPGLDNVEAIEAKGQNFSLALKSDGTVWAWGSNSMGRIGVSGITYSATPIQVPGLSDIAAISAGRIHVLAMRHDGTVLAWGWNSNGQLGDGTMLDRSQPRQVTGPGGSGQINLLQPAPASFNQLPQAQIDLSAASGRAPLTVTASALNASDPDGTITGYSWTSSDGQQASGPSANFVFTQASTYNIDLLIEDDAGGRGSTRREVVVAPTAAAAVAVTPRVGMAERNSIALANDGRILTWGTSWMLGLYDAQAQNSLPEVNSLPIANGVVGAIDFAIFDFIAHVLLADGTVLSWGTNSSGEAGVGSQVDFIAQPQQVPNLPPVQALAAGHFHKMALTRDGRVFAWGSNSVGQIGVGDNDSRFQPVEVAGLSNVIAIAAGFDFSAALKSDGSVWAWGDNSNYQLGDGTQISRNRPIQVPGLANITKLFATNGGIFALRGDGTVWVTSWLPTGISDDPGPRSGARHVSAYDGIVQIAGDWNHVVALKGDGTVWTGGQQSSLALGFQESGDIPGLKQLPGISDAIGVAAGPSTGMILRRDGTVLSWGYNHYGQLGDGTLTAQQTPVLVVNETANGFLDLIPEVPNIIPQDKIPPFFLATYLKGGLTSTTLYADFRGIISSGSFASNDLGRFAAGYNVYVAANVPTLAASPYFQLNANISWSALQWPMAEFLRGVALESETSLVRAQILQNADLSSPQLTGASILVGYGTDADEMLRNGRYRTIFTVPKP